MDNNVYGVVVDGIWYSNRMEFPVKDVSNGIYSMDMSNDEFKSTISSANIDDARKFFSKVSKIRLIRGISFHDGIIPENPVQFNKLPIKVVDPSYDEFEEIEVAIIKDRVCYFIQIIYGNKSYALMDLKSLFDAKVNKTDGIKGLTPEMKIVFTFHLIERQQKEVLEPEKIIRNLMSDGGATVEFIKKNNKGFEVQWNFDDYTINTQLDKDYRVLEAGFCISHWDGTQNARSLVNVVNDYKGSYLTYTRTTK